MKSMTQQSPSGNRTVSAALGLACALSGILTGLDAEPSPSPAQSGVLLHATFDEDATPDYFAGRDPIEGVRNRGKTVPGVRGNAWSGRLTYRADGNIEAARGTIAVHAREPYFVVLSREWGFYHWMCVLYQEGDSLRPWVLDLAGSQRGTEFGIADFDLTQWHHYALTWDRLRGSRFYVDGKLASEDWGPDRGWARLLTPCAITARVKSGIDDLYILNRVLSEPEVAALSQGNRPAPMPPASVAIPRRVSEEYGYEAGGGELLEAGSKPLLVRQVRIEQAKSRTVTMTWVHDGRNHPFHRGQRLQPGRRRCRECRDSSLR